MDEMWRDLLEGNDPDLTRMQRFFRRIPNAPRCKICAMPFGRPGSLLSRPLGFRRWAANPTLCTFCARGLDKERGGAEIEATFLFADIRGSTGLAETLRPTEFHALLERFYHVAAQAIDADGGLVDKYLGDGVVAMFVPVFARAGGPAASAIRAGRAILAATGHGTASPPWVPVGIGIHTGPAFVGVMGTEGGQLDFTGVGDAVNIAARLGSAGGAGELLVSTATATSAELDTTGLEGRTLELKG
ncbi:MAG TPA: adenylate/guanylate cyclase domain-containing protein, partial [Candidatus Eisenbacteria bacterium]|nr:adenylate/guanylate cyclase domain-containing protein [Candidatus Eisenbacteria bacterium]